MNYKNLNFILLALWSTTFSMSDEVQEKLSTSQTEDASTQEARKYVMNNVLSNIVHAMVHHDHNNNRYSVIPGLTLYLFDKSDLSGSEQTLSDNQAKNLDHFATILDDFLKKHWDNTKSLRVVGQAAANLTAKPTYLHWERVKTQQSPNRLLTSCLHDYSF